MVNRGGIKIGVAVALAVAAALTIGAGFPGFPLKRCSPDAVVAGTVCLDKYEASVWRVPNPTASNAALVTRIQLGRASRADLLAGGATQVGVVTGDYAPCAVNGQNCGNDIFAVSLPSATPSAFASWFQAQEACANSGKRLPTSAEWQVGANGTPDPGPDDQTTDCTTDAQGGLSLTGSRNRCVSARGAFDMAGNVSEWVADWVPASTFCPGWASFSGDTMCLSTADTTRNSPGALVRGGAFFDRAQAGPMAVAEFAPFHSTSFVGFRCAR